MADAAWARHVAQGIGQAGHSFDIADLAAEGFDPRFTEHDHAAHLQRIPPSPDVVREQRRIDRADALVAMKTQIDHGIFDYCGARVVASTFLLAAEGVQEAEQLHAAHTMGAAVFAGTASVPPPAKLQACA